MLLSITRLGPARQRLSKSFSVVGIDVDTARRVLGGRATSADGWTVRVAEGDAPHLWVLQTPLLWLGTFAARERAFAALSTAVQDMARAVAQSGGAVVPTGVSFGATHPATGGDLHVCEVLDEVEQEVACNLLREHSAVLIALTGRGAVTDRRPTDRVGSRWLAGSTQHLATRFLASTSDAHLRRVTEELRRVDGVARPERMDVFPETASDGTRCVAVRCIEAAPSLSTSRAHALLVQAVVMHARRMVRDGRRVGNHRQADIERNRARAIADGLRAQLTRDPGRGDTPRPPESARVTGRRLIAEVAGSLRGLEATAEELAPLVLPLEMPDFDPDAATTDSHLLSEAARHGAQALANVAYAMPSRADAGGLVLATALERDHGTVTVVLGPLRDRLAGIAEARRERPVHERGDAGRGGQGQHGRNRPDQRQNDRRDPRRRTGQGGARRNDGPRGEGRGDNPHGRRNGQAQRDDRSGRDRGAQPRRHGQHGHDADRRGRPDERRLPERRDERQSDGQGRHRQDPPTQGGDET